MPPPTPTLSRPWSLALVLALAALLRLWALDDRPMHADEAVQAYIFADLLEHGEYLYDPAHYHGPLPHFLNLGVQTALGVRRLDDLAAWQFRLLPALAGLAVVALSWSIARSAGRGAAICAGLLAATSPLAVYFSRMAIHETLLVAAALALPWAALRTRQTKRWRWALATGLALGALLSTKETWGIVLFSYTVAALIVPGPGATLSALRTTGWRRVTTATLTALLVATAHYTNFGRHPRGLLDAALTFFRYETGAGHAKPWHYYLTDLLSLRPCGGWVSGEGIITGLALAGLVLAWQRRGPKPPPLASFLALAGATQVVLYSALAYKTPWLMLVPVALLTPWAGWAARQLVPPDGNAARTPAIAGLILSWLLLNAGPAIDINFRRHSLQEIPYIYAPTNPYAAKALERVLSTLPTDAHIAVIGDDYWPLPWLLRARRATTGYFEQSPPEIEDFALLIHAGAESEIAPDDKSEHLIELRPGYSLKTTPIGE